jgi:uncharacterized membrane protein YkvA (DUF1232 family)
VRILLFEKQGEVQKVFSTLFRRSPTTLIRQEPTIGMNWKNQAQRVQREAQFYYFAFKHPRVPWYAKLVAACSAGYLFSPIQLIPSYIPVIGFLDDFFVLFVGAKLLQRLIPPEVLAECRQLALAAEIRRKEEIRSTPAVIAFVAIAAVWLLVAVGASILVARYISPDKAAAK